LAYVCFNKFETKSLKILRSDHVGYKFDLSPYARSFIFES
jgi:hypothetical protein